MSKDIQDKYCLGSNQHNHKSNNLLQKPSIKEKLANLQKEQVHVPIINPGTPNHASPSPSSHNSAAGAAPPSSPTNEQKFNFNSLKYTKYDKKEDAKALYKLHDDVDDDDDGSISFKESQYFFESNNNRDSANVIQNFESDNDGEITFNELWNFWITSKVHNWTNLELITWLENECEISEYTETFKIRNFTGAILPRLALSDFSFLKQIGIRSFIHRRRIMLKAMDAVLYGPPRKRHSFYKDAIVVFAIVLAVGAMFFSRVQQSRLNKQIDGLIDKMRANETSESSSPQHELTSSQTTDDATEEHEQMDKETIKNLEEQVDQLRAALHKASKIQSQASQEAQSSRRNQQQQQPVQIITQPIFTKELVQLLAHCKQAEDNLLKHEHNEAMKMHKKVRNDLGRLQKKKNTLFGAMQLIHGEGLDALDSEISEAKAYIDRVAKMKSKSKDRWSRVQTVLTEASKNTASHATSSGNISHLSSTGSRGRKSMESKVGKQGSGDSTTAGLAGRAHGVMAANYMIQQSSSKQAVDRSRDKKSSTRREGLSPNRQTSEKIIKSSASSPLMQQRPATMERGPRHSTKTNKQEMAQLYNKYVNSNQNQTNNNSKVQVEKLLKPSDTKLQNSDSRRSKVEGHNIHNLKTQTQNTGIASPTNNYFNTNVLPKSLQNVQELQQSQTNMQNSNVQTSNMQTRTSVISKSRSSQFDVNHHNNNKQVKVELLESSADPAESNRIVQVTNKRSKSSQPRGPRQKSPTDGGNQNLPKPRESITNRPLQKVPVPQSKSENRIHTTTQPLNDTIVNGQSLKNSNKNNTAVCTDKETQEDHHSTTSSISFNNSVTVANFPKESKIKESMSASHLLEQDRGRDRERDQDRDPVNGQANGQISIRNGMLENKKHSRSNTSLTSFGLGKKISSVTHFFKRSKSKKSKVLLGGREN